MIKIWVWFLHESCRSMPQLSAAKISGQLDLSTQSYDQMNKHCSFDHFTQAECKSLGLGQFLGQLGLVFWVGFLHKSCAIMCLVLYAIGLAPIEPIQLHL